MKREIEELLMCENAGLKLSNCCRLHRWRKDALKGDVDCLMAEFSIERAFDYQVYIHSRDWRGIINEVIDAHQKAFGSVCDKLINDLGAGYLIDGSVYKIG